MRVAERVAECACALPAGCRPTRFDEVTRPPSTRTPCSPTFPSLSYTESLNATCTSTAFRPSCCAGGDTNRPSRGLVDLTSEHE